MPFWEFVFDEFERDKNTKIHVVELLARRRRASKAAPRCLEGGAPRRQRRKEEKKRKEKKRKEKKRKEKKERKKKVTV